MSQPNYCDDLKFGNLVDNQVTSAHDFYSELISTNHLKKVMKTSSSYTWEDYGKDIVNDAIPWIAFACFAFLIFILAIVFRFMSYVCCKQKIKHRGDLIRNICVFFSFLITFIALGCCAFLIHYSDSGYQSYMQLQCASGRIPYVLSYGDLDVQWLGLEDTQSTLTNLSMVISTDYVDDTENLWANTDWLDESPSSFNLFISNYYTDFSTATVENPSPYSSNQIPLTYIQNLGPINDPSSNTGMIYQEYYEKLYPAVFAMIGLKNASLYSTHHIQDTLSLIKTAQGDISEFIEGNDDVKSNVDNWVVDNKDSAKGYWRGFSISIVIWGWFICIGVLITVSAQALNKPGLAHGLCCFWVLTGLFSVLGFILTVGVLSMGIVTEDSCGIFDDLLTPQGLEEYTVIIPDYMFKYMNVCMNGNGDLVTVLALEAAFVELQQIETLGKLIIDMNINSSIGNFSSISKNQASINKLETYSGITPETLSSDQTPEYNLAQFNLYTNKNLIGSYQGNCTVKFSSDNWVFLASNCIPGYTRISSTVPAINIGSNSCLVIEEWSDESVSNRYTGYLNCSDDEIPAPNTYIETITKYHNSLNDFQISVDLLAGNLAANLNKINENVTKTGYNLAGQYNEINTVYTSPDKLGSLFSDIYGKDGLLFNLNCSFVNPYMHRLKKSMCTNSRDSLYQIFVYVFILSFLMMCLEFINLYLSKALLRRDDSIID